MTFKYLEIILTGAVLTKMNIRRVYRVGASMAYNAVLRAGFAM